MSVENFFKYARDRQIIHLSRQAGYPKPWTRDPILRDNRFCNVFREDDKTTAWFRENMRNVLSGTHHVLLATVAFRWFNRIETGKALCSLKIGIQNGCFDVEEARAEILRHRELGPYVTGAYIIKTPDGMGKLDGVLWCIHQFLQQGGNNLAEDMMYRAKTANSYSLEEAHNCLVEFPFMGDFMAYEVVTDLRHTKLLRNAPDICSWANPGPGAARGWARVEGKSPDTYNRSSKSDRKILIAGMQELLDYSRREQYWPIEWGRWEMREVEHTLCEFDKYVRAQEGGRMKQRYNGKPE